jgi:excisionase family DNA binding protein
MKITFEELPLAVTMLHEKLESIEQLLRKKTDSSGPAPDELFTIPQAANFLSLAPATLYGLIHKGQIPHMKRSKRVYFSRQELFDYLKQGKRKANFEIEEGIGEYLKSKKIGSR